MERTDFQLLFKQMGKIYNGKLCLPAGTCKLCFFSRNINCTTRSFCRRNIFFFYISTLLFFFHLESCLFQLFLSFKLSFVFLLNIISIRNYTVHFYGFFIIKIIFNNYKNRSHSKIIVIIYNKTPDFFLCVVFYKIVIFIFIISG